MPRRPALVARTRPWGWAAPGQLLGSSWAARHRGAPCAAPRAVRGQHPARHLVRSVDTTLRGTPARSVDTTLRGTPCGPWTDDRQEGTGPWIHAPRGMSQTAAAGGCPHPRSWHAKSSTSRGTILTSDRLESGWHTSNRATRTRGTILTSDRLESGWHTPSRSARARNSARDPSPHTELGDPSPHTEPGDPSPRPESPTESHLRPRDRLHRRHRRPATCTAGTSARQRARPAPSRAVRE